MKAERKSIESNDKSVSLGDRNGNRQTRSPAFFFLFLHPLAMLAFLLPLNNTPLFFCFLGFKFRFCKIIRFLSIAAIGFMFSSFGSLPPIVEIWHSARWHYCLCLILLFIGVIVNRLLAFSSPFPISHWPFIRYFPYSLFFPYLFYPLSYLVCFFKRWVRVFGSFKSCCMNINPFFVSSFISISFSLTTQI